MIRGETVNPQWPPPPRRPPNKLSKPRTNSSTNLLNLKTTGPPSRRNSKLNDGAHGYSTVSVDLVGGEESERRESTQRKRMSMFRSKSAQPKSEPLQIHSGVHIDFWERSPVACFHNFNPPTFLRRTRVAHPIFARNTITPLIFTPVYRIELLSSQIDFQLLPYFTATRSLDSFFLKYFFLGGNFKSFAISTPQVGPSFSSGLNSNPLINLIILLTNPIIL